MTEATRITIDNIERMIEKIAETEYRRGYADALKEKELTEKHWSIDQKAMESKHSEIMLKLADMWQERIKEREDAITRNKV